MSLIAVRRLRRSSSLLSLLFAAACTTAADTTSVPDGDTTVVSVVISQGGASLQVGTTLQLSAVAKNANGSAVAGRTATWSSTAPTIASVSQGGLVTANASGTAEIEATVDGKVGSARVDVYEPVTQSGTITISPSERYQTMRGWQAGSNWGADHDNSSLVANEVLNRAVDELGIDRVRLGIQSGVENPEDWYSEWLAHTVTDSAYRCNRYNSINDNDDPFTLNPAGFQFAQVDHQVDETVVPLRQRLQARGENLFVVLTYLAFTRGNCDGTVFHHSGEEYGEFILAAFQHLQQKYGFVPDEVELINEPDNPGWQFGEAPLAGMLAAAARRLKNAGFTPAFMAPSTTSTAHAIPYYESLIATPGNADVIPELSYHRYGGNAGDLQAIGTEASAHGITAVMGEKNGASVQQLYEDLTQANASAWEQGTLGFYLYPGWTDDGTAYIWEDYSNPAAPVVFLGSRSRLLAQYFRYIRRGAVRIGATSQDGGYRPTAFINANGRYVTVVWTTKGGSFTIAGLPPGTYGINYATDAAYNVEATAVTIHAGEALPVSIPGAGVISVYGK